jgi:hypothetical protein
MTAALLWIQVFLVVTLCRWVKSGVVSKDRNPFFVRAKQPKKNLWGFQNTWYFTNTISAQHSNKY